MAVGDVGASAARHPNALTQGPKGFEETVTIKNFKNERLKNAIQSLPHPRWPTRERW